MAQTTDRYEQQRLAAIRAAAAVFADKGYHGACTRDIAERLGIKQGSLYYYFRSKEEALAEVCLYAMEDYAERMDAIASSERNFRDKLTATITSHVTKYREKNEALRVYNAERLYLSPERRRRLKELGSGYRQQLENIFVAARRAGEIRADVDCHFAAQSVIGICNAWGEWIVRDTDLDLSELIDKCVDMVTIGFSKPD